MESVKVMMGDPVISEFMDLLENNEAAQAGFISLMGHLGRIEGQILEAARESAALRREIAGMREDARHPLRAALTEAASRLDHDISEAGRRLDGIKASIQESVKKAVAVVRDKGLSALNGALGFLKVKKKVETLRGHIDGCVRSANISVEKIGQISAEYHETGKHLRNIGRALRGKELIKDANPMGKLAKTAVAPVKCALVVFTGASKSAAAAVMRLEQIERAARPSALGMIRDSRQQKAAQPTGMVLERHKNRSREASL